MIINHKDGIERVVNIETIEKLVPDDFKILVSSFSPTKELIYTSFDGDYMYYLDFMLNYVLAQKCLPINPESSLGYYVSTTTHKGNKIPVMIDCINLELLCDNMWIFNPNNSYIPEGVLAEIMIWAKRKRTPISIIQCFPTHFPPYIDKKEIVRKYKTHEDCLSYIRSRNEKDQKEIRTKLFDNLTLPLTGYIIANIRNLKHIDWAREYCYEHIITPICPHTILPCIHYYANLSSTEEYLYDRLTLLGKAQCVLLFVNSSKIEEELSYLDNYSLCELLYAIKYLKKDVYLVGWNDAKVPKYQNSQWALTSSETQEVF